MKQLLETHFWNQVMFEITLNMYVIYISCIYVYVKMESGRTDNASVSVYGLYMPTFIPNSTTERRMKPLIATVQLGLPILMLNEIIQAQKDRYNLSLTHMWRCKCWFHRHLPCCADEQRLKGEGTGRRRCSVDPQVPSTNRRTVHSVLLLHRGSGCRGRGDSHWVESCRMTVSIWAQTPRPIGLW